MLNFIYISAPVQTIVRCLDTRWSADPASCIRDCNWIERRLQLYKVECPECIHSTVVQDGSIEPPNMLGKVRSIHLMASRSILMDPLSHDPMDMKMLIDHRLLGWWLQRAAQFRWLKVELKLLRTQRLENHFVKIFLLRFKILTFTNRKRSTPVSAGQAANFRCSNQRVSVVAWKLNFRSQLSCGCAQRESSSRCDFIAVNGFDFNDDCVRVSSWSHASVNSWILCFGWENTQSIFEGWISSLVSVPAFRIFSRFTKIEIGQSNEWDKWNKSYM